MPQTLKAAEQVLCCARKVGDSSWHIAEHCGLFFWMASGGAHVSEEDQGQGWGDTVV